MQKTNTWKQLYCRLGGAFLIRQLIKKKIMEKAKLGVDCFKNRYAFLLFIVVLTSLQEGRGEKDPKRLHHVINSTRRHVRDLMCHRQPLTTYAWIHAAFLIQIYTLLTLFVNCYRALSLSELVMPNCNFLELITWVQYALHSMQTQSICYQSDALVLFCNQHLNCTLLCD